MPTRPSRKDRSKKGNHVVVESQAREAGVLQNAQVGMHLSSPASAEGRPTSQDCAEVGPIPDSVRPGQTVSFEYMAARYDVVVPEGCGPGSYFLASVAKGCAVESNGCCGVDELGLSDDSTCIGADPSSEEDPMWSTDWTIEQVPPASDRTLVDAENSVDWDTDCCVEQQPDQVGFENHGCEVFDMRDVATWFSRMQQRRERALRAGKTKLVGKIVREIDTELQKSREQGSAGCNHQVHQEPVEFDGIWGEDWASLAAADCGA